MSRDDHIHPFRSVAHQPITSIRTLPLQPGYSMLERFNFLFYPDNHSKRIAEKCFITTYRQKIKRVSGQFQNCTQQSKIGRVSQTCYSGTPLYFGQNQKFPSFPETSPPRHHVTLGPPALNSFRSQVTLGPCIYKSYRLCRYLKHVISPLNH